MGWVNTDVLYGPGTWVLHVSRRHLGTSIQAVGPRTQINYCWSIQELCWFAECHAPYNITGFLLQTVQINEGVGLWIVETLQYMMEVPFGS